MTRPEDVLEFWLDELDQQAWYQGSDELDARIAKEFGAALQSAKDGGLGLWLTYPTGVLAYIILTDQMSRNIHRGTAGAYASDNLARSAASMAIDRGWDMKIDEPARQFFYMPLEHSECLTDQDRAVRLMATRMPQDGSGLLLHAQAHREIIRRFGRFPFRNAHLGRNSTAAEQAFVDAGGYGSVVKELKAA